MPITFNCACGKSLRVSDEHAGRRVKCPACAAVATVPAPTPQFEVVEDVSEPPAAPPPKARPVAKATARRDDDDDGDDRRGYSVAKKARRDDEDDEDEDDRRGRDTAKKKKRDEDDEEEERPKPKAKKKKPKWKESREDREERPNNSGGSTATAEIGGGLISMAIGGVLCGLVWTNRGAISPLGIILFIAGLIGVIKGLAGGSSE